MDSITESDKLTLDDLIAQVAAYTDISDEKAKKVVYAIFFSMIQELKHGGNIEIRGLGTFKLIDRPPKRHYTHFGKYHFTTRHTKFVKFEPSKHVHWALNPPNEQL